MKARTGPGFSGHVNWDMTLVSFQVKPAKSDTIMFPSCTCHAVRDIDLSTRRSKSRFMVSKYQSSPNLNCTYFLGLGVQLEGIKG